MIHGRFGGTTGRPYVEGKFAFPHQAHNPWAWCSFIIDTGAERSVLVPVDAARMGLDRTKLAHETKSLGIGGLSPGHNEFAMIILGDDDRGELYEFQVEAFVPEDTAEMREIDGSVLGRDVLDAMHLVYARYNDSVTMEVKGKVRDQWPRTFKVIPGLFGATAPNNLIG